MQTSSDVPEEAGINSVSASAADFLIFIPRAYRGDGSLSASSLCASTTILRYPDVDAFVTARMPRQNSLCTSAPTALARACYTCSCTVQKRKVRNACTTDAMQT